MGTFRDHRISVSCPAGYPACREAEEVLHQQFRTDLMALESGEEVSMPGKWLPSGKGSGKNISNRNPKAVTDGHYSFSYGANYELIHGFP